MNTSDDEFNPGNKKVIIRKYFLNNSGNSFY